MSETLAAYTAKRNELLTQIAAALKADERFVAAWLTGSFGRGEQDDYSDLDLRVVVADAYSESLCASPWQYGARTTGERLALFKQFGEPAVIYDAHNNAPAGGTFTYVLYEQTALNVDWMLVPQAIAQRGQKTLLLFDKVGIPLEVPPELESLEQRIISASDKVSFFWMTAASCITHLIRSDLVYFHMLLDWLHQGLHEVRWTLNGEPWQYHGGAYAALAVTRKEQIAALHSLCHQMLAIMPEVVRLGGYVPSSPMSAVEARLRIAEEISSAETGGQDPAEVLAETLHQALVNQLKSKDFLSTPGIEAAFRAAPRHVFLPGVALETVYRDDAVVTKRTDGAAVSSSSQPSLMAIMLDQLQLEAGQRVLEIGAGTGYNAALMAHIVGDSGQVVTIDIDEDIVENARSHLAAAGFEKVQVICADGGLGYPDGAPYDRIILTVNAGDIAPAWWEQLKPGGRLLLPLSLRGQQVVVAFVHAEDHLVSSVTTCGYFVALRGAFAEPGYYVQLDPEPGLYYLRLTEPRPVEAKTIDRLLAGPGRDVTTQLEVTPRQIFNGLNLWLNLRETQFCILVAHESAVERGILPNIFNSKTHTAPGLLSETSLCVLLPADKSVPGDEPAFELLVRSFGPGDELAERLIEQIKAWDAAGRPSEEHLRIKAYPRDAAYVPAPDEIVIPKRWTKLVVGWNSIE